MYSNAYLKVGEKVYSTTMNRSADDTLYLMLDDYRLEAPCLFNGLWEIEAASFERQGNVLNLDITDEEDHEVSGFSLHFDFETYLLDTQPPQAIKWHFEVKYDGVMQWVIADIPNEGRFEAIDLETIFLKVKRRYLSCTACALAGYERGGSWLFCMEEDKERLQKYPEQYNYRSWYGDLKRKDTLECFYCAGFTLA